MEKYLAPAEIIKIVDNFLNGQFVSEIAEFILCLNVALKTEKVENAIHSVTGKLAAHGINSDKGKEICVGQKGRLIF